MLKQYNFRRIAVEFKRPGTEKINGIANCAEFFSGHFDLSLVVILASSQEKIKKEAKYSPSSLKIN